MDAGLKGFGLQGLGTQRGILRWRLKISEVHGCQVFYKRMVSVISVV